MSKVDNNGRPIRQDVLQGVEIRLQDVVKHLRAGRTVEGYEQVRQLQEFVAYERAKQSTQ
jgi:hypothetical protein